MAMLRIANFHGWRVQAATAIRVVRADCVLLSSRWHKAEARNSKSVLPKKNLPSA